MRSLRIIHVIVGVIFVAMSIASRNWFGTFHPFPFVAIPALILLLVSALMLQGKVGAVVMGHCVLFVFELGLLFMACWFARKGYVNLHQYGGYGSAGIPALFLLTVSLPLYALTVLTLRRLAATTESRVGRKFHWVRGGFLFSSFVVFSLTAFSVFHIFL